jgi:AraC-like DNA-binding protein
MKYISINLYRKMIDCALAEGMERSDFTELPTPIEKMDRLEAVPAEHFFGLHEFLDEQLGPGFSVRTGQQMKIEDYGVLGLSWRTCSWAGEIFDRSERYFSLLSNTYAFRVVKGPVTATIYLNREPHRKGLELSNEATLSATVVVLQAMTETNIAPTEVTFKHGPPSDLSSYNQAFQCPVLFHHHCYSISYRTADLELRTAKADRSINAYLLKQVEEQTQGIKIAGPKIIRDVEALIKDGLPSGIPSIRQISNLLAMSSRTLTRRLADAGVTYRDLIRKTQEHLAKELLRDATKSIGEIAFFTGFSEQSAFNRAFKNWTNQTPSEFRKNSL